MMSFIKDPENFDMVKKAIMQTGDFDSSKYSNTFLLRRIEVRLRAVGLDSLIQYKKLLETSKDEREKLNKELTVHVTNFFRDASMWTLFRDNVLPVLASLKRESRQRLSIRIWCVGCSSGEEPVSVAICLKEAFGQNLGGFDVSILATDIDLATVQKAQRGEYEEVQFKELPREYKERYFNQVAPELYCVKDEIKSMIRFQVADAFSATKPKNMDIIFCRNTVIYFSSEAKAKLYMEFYDCLNKGGFFIMGKTEIVQGPARELFQIYDTHERVYAKE